MSTTLAFDSTKNKHSLYLVEDCMKTFFISLMEHTTDEINFEKKEMFPLTEKKKKNKTAIAPRCNAMLHL